VKIYGDLTKFGIVIFVLLAGLAGYAVGYSPEEQFDWLHFLKLLAGLYFLSSGSLMFNQVQEFPKDQKMPRTSKRPIASGQIKPLAAAILSIVYMVIGSDFLFQCSMTAGFLGLTTLILYNGFYVYWWKPHWAFAAVPGALPGALPVTIGYAANDPHIWRPESAYLFLILFLWQMPHFWVIALRFQDDYKAANVPVLPNVIGVKRTLYHTGLWTFVYLAMAILAPFFVQVSWAYLIVIIPTAAKILQEFIRYYRSKGQHRWLPFFLWTNLSVLIFLYVPVVDKWGFLIHLAR
jgi:heme o synthase